MADGEAFVRAFHDAHPGVTPAAFARGGSYARLAEAVPRAARVLDVACGDGALLAALAGTPGRDGALAVGVDASVAEVRAARARGCIAVQGRAQALPFADGAFDAATCHLALMLLDDLDAVARELARVLVPGGALLAVLGGGPVAGDADGVYERWLAATRPLREALPPLALGDRRASREDGWRDVFRGFTDVQFTRFEVDLGGTRAEVWDTLATSYACARVDRGALVAAFEALLPVATAAHIPLRAVLWLARATRP